MIKLARNGYTEDEIKAVLHGTQGARSVSFRYDLLDKFNQFKTTLYNVTAASIDYGVFNEINRTADFSIIEQKAVQIDYLSDRIRPYMLIEMPAMNKMAKKKFRYIRDWTNQSNLSAFNLWCEIQAYDKNGLNVALGKPVTGSSPISPDGNFSYTYVTDGITGLTPHARAANGGLQNVVVDLGEPMEFEKITVWHYYGNSGTPRVMRNTKTEVSEDGVTWFTVYDSAVSGTYPEAEEGQTFKVEIMERVDRPKGKIEFPLGIFLLSSPERNHVAEGITRSIEAYDLSKILHDDHVEDIYTIPKGTNYKTAIVAVLQSAGITDYMIEDTTKVTTRVIEFDVGTPKIKIVNQLCNNVNFTAITVDVNGVFRSFTYLPPEQRPVDYTYDDSKTSVIMRGLNEQLDTFSIANKWVVVRTNSEEAPLRSVYTNSNPDSPTSTVNRGRTIVDYRELEDIADQSALDAYTQRIASEASQIYGKIKFDTVLMPMHDYHDIIHLKYSKFDIDAPFSEIGWTMNLEAGGVMNHDVRRVVSI